MKLTKNFYLKEFITSQTAERYNLSNEPNTDEIARMRLLCKQVLQPLRDYLDKVITVTSGFRSEKVNKKVGGSKRSQHRLGQAVDIECFEISNYELAKIIYERYSFDQLILEFYDEDKGPNSGWVHVSYVNKRDNRKEVLRAYKTKSGRTKYEPFEFENESGDQRYHNPTPNMY